MNKNFITDIWFPNTTTSEKEHYFKEMDKDNDNMISPNEFDKRFELSVTFILLKIK